MNGRLGITLAAALLLGVCAFSARQNRHLRREFPARTALASMPSGLRTLEILLGPFRGALTEVLWYRATLLQEQGRCVELAQLVRWIAALDPSATQAWAYAAWNFVFNLSAMQRDDEARWHWVREGIEHLQSRALPLNPGNPDLCRELAWIYLFKLAAPLDSAAPLYRARLAAEPAALSKEQLAKAFPSYSDLNPRLPETLALYWCEQGLKRANPVQQAALERLAVHALTGLVVTHKRIDLLAPLLARIERNRLVAPSVYEPLQRSLLNRYHLSPQLLPTSQAKGSY